MKLGPATRAFLAEEQASELDENWGPDDPRWRWDLSQDPETARQNPNERAVLMLQSRRPKEP